MPKISSENKINELTTRLKLLNEVYRIIVNNESLENTAKTLVNECAFYFEARLALCLILDYPNDIKLIGAYGCPPNFFDDKINLDDVSTIKQILENGGHFSIKNIKEKDEKFFDKISQLRVHNLECCCLEVKNNIFGVLLLGYNEQTSLDENLYEMFNDWTMASAVAISNAINLDNISNYTNKLQKLVLDRTKDLEAQTIMANEANEAKSKFLSNMTHELRTPLTAIIGYANILHDGILGEMTNPQKEAIDSICKSGDHLKSLIDDILNLARVESGKDTASPQNVNLKSVFVEVYNMISQCAKDKNISFPFPKLLPEIEKTIIYFDIKHFKQIMINLLSNAIKYTKNNGHVEIQAEKFNEFIKVSIIDSGIGISEDKISKLFERFERGDDEYSKSQVGTGIGLNLSKKLVEINGGKIGVTSEYGKGSTFYFYAPISNNNVETQEEITKEAFQNKLNGLSIMVIDSDEDSQKIISNILQSANAKVYQSNSLSVENISKNQQTDLIICDLKMGNATSISAIQQIKNSNTNIASIPILIISTSIFESEKDKILSMGASGILAKPFKPINLISTIRQLTFNKAIS